MKNRPIEAIEQSHGPDSSFSRNFDSEAGKYVNYDDADDYTVVDSDEDAGAPHLA
jgi:hypothetical protein